MAHVPHLFVPAPWRDSTLQLDEATAHHVRRVLRRGSGTEVSYTDGAGTVGRGKLEGDLVARGPERAVMPSPPIAIATATPHAADRVRYLVEKCAELGVTRIVWITTEHSQGRPPRNDKAHAWAVAALNQSRGAYLTEIEGPVALAEIAASENVVVADAEGAPARDLDWKLPVTIVIGPEGGLTPGEVGNAQRLSLGRRILRTETAAVVGAATALQWVSPT